MDESIDIGYFPFPTTPDEWATVTFVVAIVAFIAWRVWTTPQK
jgi:hypothetical protein